MTTQPVPPELQSKIRMWRAKMADGTITLPEMKEAIIALRGGRKAALEASEASKGSKTKRPAKNANDMLAELEGIQ
jgi:hypothetical protein